MRQIRPRKGHEHNQHENQETNYDDLQRKLKARHLTMIAIGGAVGTGLFVASGASISQAGPGGALLMYCLIGLMVYCLMTSLGELAVHMPVAGSFVTYSALYVEEGFGFALGWSYWFSLAVTIAVELAAAQLVLHLVIRLFNQPRSAFLLPISRFKMIFQLPIRVNTHPHTYSNFHIFDNRCRIRFYAVLVSFHQM